MPDVLSEIMQRVRLTACVYFQRDFCTPWSMRMADTGFAQFHVITSGACQLQMGRDSRSVGTGDILFFPRSAAHILSDQQGQTSVSGPDFMASLSTDMPMFANGPLSTRMICGHYEYQWDTAHPLFAQLPDLVHIPASVQGQSPAIAPLLLLILSELSHGEPGSKLTVEYLATVLLVQALRHHCRLEGGKTGFMAALNDARLGRAISRIHADFSQSLNLNQLADTAAMSRSSFAQRFSEVVGMSPIDYLAHWRMLVAQDLLQSTEDQVADIAEQVGYRSDIAFARAFKRNFGQTPSESRRQRQG